MSQQLDAIGAQSTALGRLGKSDGKDAPVSPTGEEHLRVPLNPPDKFVVR